MKLNVMSFNLRVECEGDGINNFPNRRQNVLRAIREENPDLIGFQEATDSAKDFLRQELSDTYVILGCGRSRHSRGESVCLAYRRNLFELISFETFWLSNEPNRPGSRYEGSDQSQCPRMTVHAELSPKGMDETIHFFNTHLDHEGTRARVLGMTQIQQHISTCNGKFVLTGDMNAQPDAPVIQMATKLKSRAVVDATESLTLTFHNYGRITEHCKIDYIFTDGAPLGAHAVADEHRDGVYISDHFPICAEIEF